MVKEYVRIPYIEYDVTLRLKSVDGTILFEAPTQRISEAADKWDALIQAAGKVICPDGRTLDKVAPAGNLWKWASIKKVSPAKEYHRRVEEL